MLIKKISDLRRGGEGVGEQAVSELVALMDSVMVAIVLKRVFIKFQIKVIGHKHL